MWRDQHCVWDFPSPQKQLQWFKTFYFSCLFSSVTQIQKNPEVLHGHPEPDFFTPSDGFLPRDDKGIMYGESCLKGDGGDILIAWSVLGMQANRRKIPQSQRLGVCWKMCSVSVFFFFMQTFSNVHKKNTDCKSWHRSVCTQSTAGPNGTECFLGRWHQACPHIFLSFHLFKFKLFTLFFYYHWT